MLPTGSVFVVRRAGNRAIVFSERAAAGFIPRPDFCGLISIICHLLTTCLHSGGVEQCSSLLTGRLTGGTFRLGEIFNLLASVCLIEVYDYVDLCPVSVTRADNQAKSRAAQAVLF